MTNVDLNMHAFSCQVKDVLLHKENYLQHFSAYKTVQLLNYKTLKSRKTKKSSEICSTTKKLKTTSIRVLELAN